MVVTIETLRARLSAYLEAEARILQGQAVRHESGRMLTQADLAQVRAEIDQLTQRIARLEGGVARTAAPRG